MKNIVLIITAFVLFASCEKEISLDMPDYTPSVVVEGFIANNMSPVVALTRNVDYVSTAGQELYENSFIHNALVTIQAEKGTLDTLQEVNQTNEKTGLKTSIYTTENIIGEVGKSYALTIQVDGKTYTSIATIPDLVKITDIWYEDHPDVENDSFKIVWVKILDPKGPNYYRYTSEINGEHGPQPEISTISDKAFDGNEYIKAVDSGLGNEEQDMHGGVSGYFKTGDTITVKWANAEKTYYDAWTTIDFKRSQNQNPFLNPTRIAGNIDGCLGYWSGLGVDARSIVLE